MDGSSAESANLQGGCQYEKTFAEAEAICYDNGMRLCSEAEINSDVACGSGCGFDGQQVWVAEPLYHFGLTASDYCSTESVSDDQCLEAVKYLRGTDYGFEVGSWSGKDEGKPPGCSWHGPPNYRVVYNTNLDDIATAHGFNNGEFTPVCTGAAIPVAAHLGIPASDYCSTADVSIESCLQAGRNILPDGAEPDDPTLNYGTWPDVPHGCSMNMSNYRIVYNTNSEALNNGNFQPICTGTMIQPVAHLGVLGSDYCSTADVSIQDCLHAGHNLLPEGAEQADQTLFITTEAKTVPQGCSMDTSNYRILYSSNPNARNDGRYQPICTGSGIVPVSAHLDTQALDHCSSAPVPIESCLQAVRDLAPPGQEQVPLTSGSSTNKPPGCSMETETHTAHFNTANSGHNDGTFTLVCGDASSVQEEVDAMQEVIEDLVGRVEALEDHI